MERETSPVTTRPQLGNQPSYHFWSGHETRVVVSVIQRSEQVYWQKRSLKVGTYEDPRTPKTNEQYRREKDQRSNKKQKKKA